MFRSSRQLLPFLTFIIAVCLWNMDFAGLGNVVYLPFFTHNLIVNSMNFYLMSFIVELIAFLLIYKKTVVIPIYISGMFSNLILFYAENSHIIGITEYGLAYNSIMWLVMIPALIIPIFYEWLQEKGMFLNIQS